MVKNLPANTRDMSSIPGLENPLVEGMATHSSILAWRFPMDRGAWWATVHVVTESDTTEQLSTAQHSTRTSIGYFPCCLPVLISQMQIAGWESPALPDINKTTPMTRHCSNYLITTTVLILWLNTLNNCKFTFLKTC